MKHYDSVNLTGSAVEFVLLGGFISGYLYNWIMQEFLQSLNGKEVDISFGGTGNVRGKIVDLKNGVLFMDDEDGRTVCVAIDKITTVCEVKEHLSRPGFVI